MRYTTALASSADEVRLLLRLRYEVFNVELKQGVDNDVGLDRDRFDRTCDHLMVTTAAGHPVGTYRLRTSDPGRNLRFYSDDDFDLSALPSRVLEHGVEIGRAAIHKAHRNGRVLYHLWRGLGRYLHQHDKRYLFGCCSIPTTDQAAAWATYRELRRAGSVHSEIAVPVRRERRCLDRPTGTNATVLPPLLTGYLNMGAMVCSEPSLDRAFKVCSFFVLLDVAALAPRARRAFMGRHDTTCSS